MLHYLQEDNDLEQAKLNFTNYLKSNTCHISTHEKNILTKLVDEIQQNAYSSGYANHEFDQND